MIKKIIQVCHLNGLVKQWRLWQTKRLCYSVFKQDAERFLLNSVEYTADERCLLTRIIKRGHVLEKGLTMPDRRLGFGRENLLALIDDLHAYIKPPADVNCMITDILSAISEYRAIHDSSGYRLDAPLKQAIDHILSVACGSGETQIEITKEEYFSQTGASFDVFSRSRHSCRTFSGEIPLETIKNAIALANHAPSACNRQPCRVHVVANKEMLHACLALQNGNRGFGHLADKLLVLTVDLRTVWLSERNDLFTNGGIYLMNLCYALHYYHVAHCILNWSPQIEESPHTYTPNDVKIRQLLKLNPAECIAAIILCGDVPETFKLARSQRLGVDDVVVVHH